MGGKGSNADVNTSTTNQKQTSTYDPAGKGIMKGVAARANDVSNLPFNPYTGQMVADMTPEQLAAMGQVGDLWGQVQPYMQQAAQYFNETAQPMTAEEIERMYNPFAGNVESFLNAQHDRDMTKLRTGLTAGAGGIGADRIAVGEVQGNNTYERDVLGPMRAKMWQDAIAATQGNRGIEQAAAFGLGNLGGQYMNTGLAGSQALFGMGSAEQQTEQAKLTAAYNEFMRKNAYPFQTAQFNAGIRLPAAGGMGGTTRGTATGTTATNPADPSWWSQLLGGGMALAGGASELGWHPFASSPAGNAAATPSRHKRGGPVGYSLGGAPGLTDAAGYVPDAPPLQIPNSAPPAINFMPPTQQQPVSGSGGKGSNIMDTAMKMLPMLKDGGPIRRASGGQSGFGLSDLASLVSPAYALSQGKSPFAGGILGMAIPGMGPTNEQKEGFNNIGGMMGGLFSNPFAGMTMARNGGPIHAQAGAAIPGFSSEAYPDAPFFDLDPSMFREAPPPPLPQQPQPFKVGPAPDDPSQGGNGAWPFPDQHWKPNSPGYTADTMQAPEGSGLPPLPPDETQTGFPARNQTDTKEPFVNRINDAYGTMGATGAPGGYLNRLTRNPLFLMGLGIMGEKSPYAGANIGAGALQGLQARNSIEQIDANRQAKYINDMLQAAGTDLRGREVTLQEEMRPLTIENQIANGLWQRGYSQDEITAALAGMHKRHPEIFQGAGAGQIPEDIPPPAGDQADGNGEVISQPAGYAIRYDEGANPKKAVPLNSVPAKPDEYVGGGDLTKYSGPLYAQRTKAMFDQAEKANAAAQQQMGTYQQSMLEFSKLAKKGFTAPGPHFDERIGLSRWAAGLKTLSDTGDEHSPFSEETIREMGKIAPGEALIKYQTRMGFDLARTLGTREAMQVIQQALAAVQNGNLTPAGYLAIASGVRAGIDRDIERYKWISDWTANAPRTAGMKSDTEFDNRVGPVSKYVSRAEDMYKVMFGMYFNNWDDATKQKIRQQFGKTYMIPDPDSYFGRL